MGLSLMRESSQPTSLSFPYSHNIVFSKHGRFLSKNRPLSRAYSVLELSHVGREGGRSHSPPSLDGTMPSSFSS
jgi:uncharacterized protein (DUF924 family)